MIAALFSAPTLGYFAGAAAPTTAMRAGDVLATASIERATVWEGESAVRVPDGVLRANQRGRPWVEQKSRPRRNRKSETMRSMVRETLLRPANFIYPLFIHDEDSNVGIASSCFSSHHASKISCSAPSTSTFSTSSAV